MLGVLLEVCFPVLQVEYLGFVCSLLVVQQTRHLVDPFEGLYFLKEFGVVNRALADLLFKLLELIENIAL